MMKKITLFMLLLVGFSLKAQVYFFEDFEAEVAGDPPSSFTVLNEDACSVNNPATFTNESWVVGDNGDAQGQFASAQSWTNPAACTVDDWLISGGIDLSSATAGTSLSWKGISFEGPNYPETYEVKISTTNTAIGSFTTLTTITNELETWTDHTISLAPYVGGTVYIAFRLISTDQSQCWIDDIEVSEPAAYDVELGAVTTNGYDQSSEFSSGQFLIVDFSERTNFQASVEVVNTGVNALDSVFLTYFLVDDVTAPTEGVAFTDSIQLVPALAPGASYTHNFEAFGLDTLFPALASDQVLDFFILADSSAFNLSSDASDVAGRILIAPAESYATPYSSSFEVADLGAGVFLFDHETWGWKYFDNDNDGATLSVVNDFTNLPAQDGSMQVYGSLVNGNQLSASAVNETMQSPEMTLAAGTAYSFSIYARTGFGVTGSFSMQLVDGDQNVIAALGSVTLTAADSAYQKYSFNYMCTTSGTDYMVNINKTSNGFIVLDLFEADELDPPVANFTASPATVCAGGTVTFTDLTSDSPTSWSWTFPGGTPGTSTAQNPTVVYNVPGTYDVTLTATNLVGTDSETKTALITVNTPTFTYYRDNDNDGFGDPANTTMTCTATVPPGYSTNSLDCNDNNAAINPDAFEIVGNAIDENCDGDLFASDVDGDGFDTSNDPVTGQDCDDNNASVYPGAPEICDGVDNDCDGQVDEGLVVETYYVDADGDGYGSPVGSIDTCETLFGYVLVGGDCNDNNAAINPGATDIPNSGVDEDCNPATGINDIAFVSALNIFPNPANQVLNLSFSLVSSENVEVSIVSVEGRVIEAINFNNAKDVNTNFNTANLNNGVYILKIKSANGLSTQKFVVRH
ncbi:MAG: MopE-related protein [Chitinophagales bacterium]